jgi:teichuronic acid biosynthesis glycosyltransferase TuaH
MEQKTILYFCAGDWDWSGPFAANRYHIYLLAQKNRVLFVNQPVWFLTPFIQRGKWRTYRTYGRIKAVQTGVSPAPSEGVDMTVFTPVVPLLFNPRLPLPGVFKRLLNRWNNELIARQAMRTLGRCYGHDVTADFLWVGSYFHGSLVSRVPHRISCALIYDELSQSPIFTPAQQQLVAQLEEDLLRQVDLVLTTSRPLYETKRKVNSRCVLLENGVPEHFLPERRAQLDAMNATALRRYRETLERMKSLPGKKIGYVGSLNLRLDGPLLVKLASEMPDVHFVFIGNLDRDFDRRALQSMRAMQNVHFWARVQHSMIPYFFELFDSLILPFALNEFTRNIYPEKLNEYLSSGKPIVSTPLEEVVRVTRDHDGTVYIAKDAEAFVTLCRRGLEEKEPALVSARQSLARANTYERRAATLEHALDELLAR